MTEQRKLPTAGPRKAIFNRYIKAGVHTCEGYQGAPDKDNPQVIVGWELVEDFTDEDTPRPMWIKGFGMGNINDFNGERAKKTKWFTNMFLDYNPEVGDAENFLGRGCRVVIKHNPGKGSHAGKTFANLSDVRDFDGELPSPSQPTFFFDFAAPTVEGIEKLFPWELEYLQSARNYSGSKLQAMIDGNTEAPSTPRSSESAPIDNDAPF
jgi:hypothetical protein